MDDYEGNPFTTIKRINTAQELLDIAFKKSMKIKPPKEREGALEKIRTHEINRINTVMSILTSKLENIINDFPSINKLHPFYTELIEIITNINDLKSILGRIYGTSTSIKQITQDLIGELLVETSTYNVKKIRKSYFGRVSSVIYQISNPLEKLEEIRVALSVLPSYNSRIPCVVVCGLPNVGKSSFIRKATSGKPEVANYPFTTKKLIFGHRDFSFLKIQFVDTPGLLDRDFFERNQIELQALAALKHLADIMIFLYDLTMNSEKEHREQINLVNEIKNFYPSSQFLIGLTKVDMLERNEIESGKKQLLDMGIVSEEDEILEISTILESGVDDIIFKIGKVLKDKIIKNGKFKGFLDIQIHPDSELDDEDNLWFLDG